MTRSVRTGFRCAFLSPRLAERKGRSSPVGEFESPARLCTHQLSHRTPPAPGPQTAPLQDEGSGLDDFGTFFSLEILPFRWGGIVASCQGCTCGRCLGLFETRFSCVPSLSFCPERSELALLAIYFAKQSVSHRCTRAHREREGGSYVERLPFSFPESSSAFTLEGRLFPPRREKSRATSGTCFISPRTKSPLGTVSRKILQ